jgi:hypothetical protein
MYSKTPVQNTYGEWLGSAAAANGVHCQDCHMPEGAHSFPGAHDPQLVASAIEVRVRRDPDRSIEASLWTQNVGHDVPTGDPFRSLVLHLAAESDCEEPLVTRSFFKRHEAPWRLAQDTSLKAPGPSGERPRRTLRFEPVQEATRWCLDLRLGHPAPNSRLEPSDFVIAVARGSITGGGDQSTPGKPDKQTPSPF